MVKIEDEEIQLEDLNDNILRPKSFSTLIGQDLLKEKLYIAIEASIDRNDPLPHICLHHNNAGMGKTTIARIIANERKCNITSLMAPSIKSVADIINVLTKTKENDIVHLDEIHGLNIRLEETLYSAMEDFNISIKTGTSQIITIPIQPFCLIGTTTHLGNLSEPLRSRFGILHHLSDYNNEEIEILIIESAKKLNISFKNNNIPKILSNVSRGIPRIGNRILHRARDFAEVNNNSIIDEDVIDETLRLEEIQSDGLSKQDVKYLVSLYNDFGFGPVGINTIAMAINEDKSTIERHIEPFLIRKGYIYKTKNGRILTADGIKYLANSS